MSSEKVDWHIPTCELRFVERDKVLRDPHDKVRVLQQLWRSPFENHSDEWRDVPLVTGPTDPNQR